MAEEPQGPAAGEDEDGLGPGTRVNDSITLVRLLGRGGMGSVWVGHDDKLDRDVAVKFISGAQDRQETLKRFKREARIAARVDHPHVVQVFDFGLLDEITPYLVMELLKGEGLDDRLDRDGRLTVSACAMLVEQLGQALSAVHAKGVVHRDIKPGNVFLLESGYEIFAKVVDFGIARPDAQVIDSTTMTVAGMLIGTPNYMSPEQLFEAKPATPTADLWALAVVAYESLTGHLPFNADTVAALGRALAKGEFKPPTAHDAALPPGLDDFFAQALAPEKQNRFNSAERFATAFSEAVYAGAASVSAGQRSLQPSSSADTLVKREGRRRSARASSPSPSVPSPVPSSGSWPRDRMGPYRLVAELGHGGMADVYLALKEDDEFGVQKLVVVKRLRPNLAEDEDFVNMIVDEARLAARLNHPNVVQTLEAGREGRQYFIAMEYLEGQPLHRVLSRAHRRDGGLPKPLAYFVLSEMLAGLHHAHELRDFDGTRLDVVHRDVSPHNVFVTYEGQVKVMDFGIAQAARRATYTSTGVVKGKVSYMAPEQARSEDLDRRVDLFAAGILLWEMEAGRRLWDNTDEVAVMHRLTSGDYPSSPLDVEPGADPRIAAICEKALAFDPTERFATAAEMQAELDATIDGIESSRTLETGRSRPDRRTLGEYVAELFAEDRKTLSAEIESQLRAMKEGGAERRPVALSMATPQPEAEEGAFAETAVDEASGAVARPVSAATGGFDVDDEPDAESVAPAKSGLARYAVAAAAVLVVAGVAISQSGSSSGTPAAETTSAPAQSPPPPKLPEPSETPEPPPGAAPEEPSESAPTASGTAPPDPASPGPSSTPPSVAAPPPALPPPGPVWGPPAVRPKDPSPPPPPPPPPSARPIDKDDPWE